MTSVNCQPVEASSSMVCVPGDNQPLSLNSPSFRLKLVSFQLGLKSKDCKLLSGIDSFLIMILPATEFTVSVSVGEVTVPLVALATLVTEPASRSA